MISTIRHENIIDPREHLHIPLHVVGLGATGSRLAMSLIELGFTNIKFYDFDIVESHNLANQIYGFKDIGVPKTTALEREIEYAKSQLQEHDTGHIHTAISWMEHRKNQLKGIEDDE